MKLRWRLGLPLQLFAPFTFRDLDPSKPLRAHQAWLDAVQDLHTQEAIYLLWVRDWREQQERWLKREDRRRGRHRSESTDPPAEP